MLAPTVIHLMDHMSLRLLGHCIVCYHVHSVLPLSFARVVLSMYTYQAEIGRIVFRGVQA
jgi:hypothetical protein